MMTYNELVAQNKSLTRAVAELSAALLYANNELSKGICAPVTGGNMRYTDVYEISEDEHCVLMKIPKTSVYAGMGTIKGPVRIEVVRL